MAPAIVVNTASTRDRDTWLFFATHSRHNETPVIVVTTTAASSDDPPPIGDIMQLSVAAVHCR